MEITEKNRFNIGDIVYCNYGTGRIIETHPEMSIVKILLPIRHFFYWPWFNTNCIRYATKEEKIKYTLDEMMQE